MYELQYLNLLNKRIKTVLFLAKIGVCLLLVGICVFLNKKTAYNNETKRISNNLAIAAAYLNTVDIDPLIRRNLEIPQDIDNTILNLFQSHFNQLALNLPEGNLILTVSHPPTNSEIMIHKTNTATPPSVIRQNFPFSGLEDLPITSGSTLRNPYVTHIEDKKVLVFPVSYHGNHVNGTLIYYTERFTISPLTMPRDLTGYLLLLFMGILITGYFSFRYIDRLMLPLSQMQKDINRKAMGNFNYKIPVKVSDEIGQLITTYNGMTDKLYATFRALTERQNTESSKEQPRQKQQQYLERSLMQRTQQQETLKRNLETSLEAEEACVKELKKLMLDNIPGTAFGFLMQKYILLWANPIRRIGDNISQTTKRYNRGELNTLDLTKNINQLKIELYEMKALLTTLLALFNDNYYIREFTLQELTDLCKTYLEPLVQQDKIQMVLETSEEDDREFTGYMTYYIGNVVVLFAWIVYILQKNNIKNPIIFLNFRMAEGSLKITLQDNSTSDSSLITESGKAYDAPFPGYNKERQHNFHHIFSTGIIRYKGSLDCTGVPRGNRYTLTFQTMTKSHE